MANIETVPSLSPATRVRSAPLRFYDRHERLVMGTLGVLIVLALWQVLVMVGLVKEVLMSTPVEVGRTLYTLFRQGTIWPNLGATVLEFGIGFTLAAVAGIVIGLVAGWYRIASVIATPWLNVLYAAPELALVPIFVMWFGIGLTFKVWLAFVATMFVVSVNTIAGVHSTEARYLDVAQTYGAGRLRTFRTVVVPGSVPYIMTGLRQGTGRAIVGVIAAEFISANKGLGFFVSLSGQTLNTPAVMAGIVVIAAFGIIVGELFRRIESLFDKWRR